MEYFKIPPERKDALLNPFWNPPDIPLSMPKGVDGLPGKWGIWQEPVMIENFIWERDAQTKEETVRVTIRVTGDSPDNMGKSHTQFYHFPVAEFEAGGPKNKLQQFEIAWKGLMGLWHAAGNTDSPSPGELDAGVLRGARVTATVKLHPDKKTNEPRFEVVRWSE